MAYYVCSGAKLKCSMGSEHSELEVVHPSNPVLLCGKPKACIMDYKPMVNIKPFGQCSSLANPAVAAATAANYGRLQKMPCIPNILSPWMPGKPNVLVKGQPALMETDKCVCVWAGPIEITDAGQSLMRDGGTAGASGAVTSDPPSPAQSFAGDGIGNFRPHIPPMPFALRGGEAQSALYVTKVEGAKETYPRQKILYKVTEYSKKKGEMSEEDRIKEIKWAVMAGDSVATRLDVRGEKITLDIDPSWEFKEITVMAYINSYSETVSQRTKVLCDPYKGTLIRGVEGGDEAIPGQDVEYRVINSNKDGTASNVAEGSDVKWAIKIGESGSIDKKMLESMRGKKTIALRMKEEWAGKDIFVMPYLNSPTPVVSVKTRVGRIAEIYWSYGKDHVRLSDISRYYEDLNVHIKTEGYSDGDNVKITIRGKDGNPLFDSTRKLDLDGMVLDNEIVFENVLEEYALA